MESTESAPSKAAWKGRSALVIPGLIALALVYVLAAKLGLKLAFQHPSATPVWAPTGIALAAFVLWGPRLWPAIFAGAYYANVTTAGTIATSLGIAAGNTLEGLLGAYLVTRFAGGRDAFDRPSTIFRWTILAAALSTAVSATIGVATLTVAGYAPFSEFATIWLTWWLGDAGGALVVAPLLILWGRDFRIKWNRRYALELPILAMILWILAELCFGVPLGFSKTHPLAFAFFPILAWSAFRLDPRATIVVAAAVAVFSVWGTLLGHGPFAIGGKNESLLLVQGFLGVMTTAALALAAAVEERRRAQKKVADLNADLEGRVEERTADVGKSQAMLAQAEAVAHLGSWEWDIPSNTLRWSDELYRIYGVDREGFTADYEGFLDRLHPEDRERVKGIVEQAYRDGRPFDFFHRIVRPDGTIRTLHGRGQVVTDPSGRPTRMFGTGLDVTEEKELERQAQLRSVELKDALTELEGFSYTVAHDLRAPLRAVASFSGLLQEEYAGKLDEGAREYLDRIARAARRMDALVQDLLSYSRLAQEEIHLEAVEVEGLAREILAQMETELRERKARVAIESPLPAVVGHPVMLRQALANLIGNAVKFVAPGVDPEVRLRAEARGRSARIWVEDNGIGIPAAYHKTIFDVFHQLEPGRFPGTGIGLAIVRKTVARMKGETGVESAAGQGSRFWIELPLAKGPPAEPQRRRVAEKRPQA